jgi:hypothetical protein
LIIARPTDSIFGPRSARPVRGCVGLPRSARRFAACSRRLPSLRCSAVRFAHGLRCSLSPDAGGRSRCWIASLRSAVRGLNPASSLPALLGGSLRSRPPLLAQSRRRRPLTRGHLPNPSGTHLAVPFRAFRRPPLQPRFRQGPACVAQARRFLSQPSSFPYTSSHRSATGARRPWGPPLPSRPGTGTGDLPGNPHPCTHRRFPAHPPLRPPPGLHPRPPLPRTLPRTSLSPLRASGRGVGVKPVGGCRAWALPWSDGAVARAG